MMSIVFHNYQTLLNKSFFKFVDDEEHKKDDNNINSIILKREIDKWNNFSSILRKHNWELFEEMLQSSLNKYSNAINAKEETILNKIIDNVFVIGTI